MFEKARKVPSASFFSVTGSHGMTAALEQKSLLHRSPTAPKIDAGIGALTLCPCRRAPEQLPKTGRP
jgi:hypothetical protein